MVDIVQKSFSNGEISPLLHSRNELQQYQSALKTCKNFFVHPEGGASNRQGTEYVGDTEDSTKKTRVIPFVFSSEDSYIVELNKDVLRFRRNGGLVLLDYTPAAWGASAWNFSQAEYTGENGSVSGPPSPGAFDFNGTGTSIAVLDISGNSAGSNGGVYTASLSVAYDLTTIGSRTKTLTVSNTYMDNPQDCVFSSDGTKFYVIGFNLSPTTAKLVRYNLSVAYDLGTATFNNVVTVGTVGLARSISFSDDGTRLMIVSGNGDTSRVYSFSLTAWDTTTLSYDSVFLNPFLNGLGDAYKCRLADSGTKLFILEFYGAQVVLYSLETANDLSSAVYTGDRENVFGQTSTLVGGLGIKPNGEYFYVCSWTNDNIYEYSMLGGLYNAGDYVLNLTKNYICLKDHIFDADKEPGVGVEQDQYWYEIISTVEIPSPYDESQLFDVSYVQSADIITLTHKDIPTRELKRFSHTSWAIVEVPFIPDIEPPTSVSGTGGSGTSHNYVVTSISADTGEESLASNVAANLESGGVLSWTAEPDASSYNVYKAKNGLYGYIGTAVGVSFTDASTAPDFTLPLPESREVLSDSGKYPITVDYHEQRIVYGGSIDKPQQLEFSQVGNFHNFILSETAKADDAISVSIDSAQINEVRHVLSLDDLLVFTAGAVYQVWSGNNTFSFANIRTKKRAGVGASKVRPVIVNSSAIFAQARGDAIYDVRYINESGGFVSENISVIASHLFKGRKVVEWAYAERPNAIVWMVMDDGTMVGLTYIREQNVVAWHQHQTRSGDVIESICSIPEGDEDVPYFVVKRSVDGVDKRYIERLHTRQFSALEDAFFIDSGLTYDGTATTSITGLDHLEGESVIALADGNVHPAMTVTSGAVTLNNASSKVHVGLSYSSEIETLEPPVEEWRGKRKRVSEIVLSLFDTRGGLAGHATDQLFPMKQTMQGVWGSPAPLIDDYVYVNIEPTFENYGSIIVQQPDPLPMTIRAIVPDYETED